MNKKPIEKFKNIEQAYACLKEWQDRLFLNHWVIKLALVDKCEIDGKECLGTCLPYITRNTAYIEILKYNDTAKTDITKYCVEATLIHELLHLKYNWVEVEYGQSIPVAYYDIKEHQLLEQMSKSLIMAKYNLTLDYFKNF